MADSVQLSIELATDKVVGPAKKAAEAIDKVAKSMAGLGKSLGKRQRDKGGKSFMGGTDWRTIAVRAKQLERNQAKLSRGTKKATKTNASFVAGLKGVIGSTMRAAAAIPIVGTAMAAAWKITKMVASAWMSLAKSVLGAVLATEKFVPVGTEAYAAQKSLMKIANKLGKSFKSVAKDFQAFVDAGVSAQMAKELIMLGHAPGLNLKKFKSELKAIAKSPADIKRVGEAFKVIDKSLSAGKMSASGFQKVLRATGVGEMQLLLRLSGLTGKSIKQLSKELDQGKLSAKSTMEAFQQLFAEAKGGKKAAATLGGSFAKLKATFGNTLTQIGLDVGPALRKNIIPAIEDMMKALRSPAGKAAIRKIGEAIKWAARMFKVAWHAIKNIIGGIVEGFGKAGGALDFSGKLTPEQFKAIGTAAKDFGKNLGTIAAKLTEIVAKIKSLVSTFGKVMTLGGGSKGPDQLFDPLKMLRGTMGTQGVGKSMTDGLVAGIKGGKSSVVASMLSVVKAAIAAAKSALGTRSPSKVFGYLGKMSAMGYAEGMSSMNAIPALHGTAQLSPGLGGGGGSTFNQTNVFETSVNEAASAAATAAEIKKQQLLQMAAAFERAALELGVGVR